MATDLKDKLSALKIERDERPPSSWTPLRIGILLGIVVIAAAAAALALRPRAVQVKTTVVQETTQGAGGAASVLNASGYVTARRQATVSSKITGKVVEVLVEEGMQVKQGQVLARLDGSQMQQALGLSEAQLEAARRAILESEARLREATIRKNRIGGLAAQGVASPADRDAVDAEVEVIAPRSRRSASRRARRARGRDRPPEPRRHGHPRALRRGRDLEERPARRDHLADVRRRRLHPHRDLDDRGHGVARDRGGRQRGVHPARPARAEGAGDARRVPRLADPRARHHDDPAADRQKATVTVRIAFDQLDPRILPDMGIKVAFLADAAQPGAAAPGGARVVRVPRAAIRGGSGDEYVFVVKAEGKLERRAIKIGASSDDPVDVVAGLSAGERVVVEGPSDLKPDMIVAERKE
jgi:multidrug efflux pump subunit AcrA (membrane-fusion protein)